MKHLIVAVFIGMQVLLLTEVWAASTIITPRTHLESLTQCHWLMAGNEEESSEEQAESTEEDEEPDCD